MHAKLLFSLLLLASSLVPAFSQTTTYANVAYGSDPAQIMDIYVPTGNEVHPTIILLHGGAWVSGDKQALSPIADYFAKQGYTVANINYRLATLTSNQYPAAIDDAHLAVLFLQKKATAYKVDGSRIAAFGTSAGANLALSLGTQGWVNAVVDFYGPADFTDPNFLGESFQGQSCSQFLEEHYFGVSFTQNPTLYANASPLNNISTKMPPTIIFHGTLDQLVPVTQSENLHEQLHDLGHRFPTQHRDRTWPRISDAFFLQPAAGSTTVRDLSQYLHALSEGSQRQGDAHVTVKLNKGKCYIWSLTNAMEDVGMLALSALTGG